MPLGSSADACDQLWSVVHHVDINGEIVGDNLANILSRFNSPLAEKDLILSCKWHKNKICNLCTIDETPLFFVKEMWQPKFLLEAIGIHVGLHFLDKEMSFQDYLFGKWTPPGQKPIPVVITTYLAGKALAKKQMAGFYKELGRQHAYHEILALYDVDWRHFIVQGNRLARIDLGRSFANLGMVYQGFWDMQYDKKLKKNTDFLAGRDEELAVIKRNIEAKKTAFNILLDLLVALGNTKSFYIDFPVRDFLSDLEIYWKTFSPIDVLGLLGRDGIITKK